MSRINVKLEDHAGDKGNAIIGKKIFRVEDMVYKIDARLKTIEGLVSILNTQMIDVKIRIEDIENELE